jgi:hypothetical protein
MAKAKRPKFLTRLVPCTRVEIKKLQRQVRDALDLASKHDPDHAQLLADHARWLASEPPLHVRIDILERQVQILERQVQRLGAPQYRVARKGKSKR